MVTVAYTDVEVRYLSSWPAGVTDATVTALCAQAEAYIQGKSPETVTLTGTAAVQLSIDLVVNWITYAQYTHAGGAGATGIPAPIVWTREMETRYQSLLMGTEEQIDILDSHNYDVE